MGKATAVYMDYDNLYRSINESYSQFKTSEVVKKILEHLISPKMNLDNKSILFYTA